MELTFSTLKLKAPDGWADRSMATFMMPPKPVDPRMMQKSEASPGNIAVSWVAATPQSADEYLTTQEPNLKQVGEGYTVKTRSTQEDMGVLEAQFSQGGQLLTQVVCTRKVGSVQVMVVGTALPPFMADVRSAALACAKSLTPAG